MDNDLTHIVAIVDYGMGNLFSVKQACRHAGLKAVITSSRKEILEADAVILPGVGAFGDAMETLRQLDLVSALKEVALSSKPLVGICLGMQMLMTESFEFGRHAGLGIIPGIVTRFHAPRGPDGILKVPHVCWNQMKQKGTGIDPWAGSLLDGLADGVFMYFVHSFYVKPENKEMVIATTRYGHIEFSSAVKYRNVFGCQGHPERSGRNGLVIYQNLARILKEGESISQNEISGINRHKEKLYGKSENPGQAVTHSASGN
jgi:glutamine amidotransferase